MVKKSTTVKKDIEITKEDNFDEFQNNDIDIDNDNDDTGSINWDELEALSEDNNIVENTEVKVPVEKMKINNSASSILNKIINERNEIKESKTRKTTTKKSFQMEDGSSEILGKEKRALLEKINKYKSLFADNKKIKEFKLRKNITEEYLKEVLIEFEAIIETENVDGFITDGIILCLKQIEGVTTKYKRYNITGMADMLKANPQFHKTMKQLYLKYNVYKSVPPEQQLVMIIFTTAYVAMEKNKRKAEIEENLNQPFNETI